METLTTIVGILSLLGISIVVEKLPIKVSPWTAMKNFFTKDIADKVSEIDKKIDTVDKKTDLNEADRIRHTILLYKKNLDSGFGMTENEFEYVSKIYDKYKNELHGNSFITKTFEEITRMYLEQNKK